MADVGQELQPAAAGNRAAVRLPIGNARAVNGEQYAFVELSTDRNAYFAQELIHLTLRLGVDAEFAKTNVLQLFTQTLDMPVQLQVPWIDALPGTAAVGESTQPDTTRRDPSYFTCVVNDEIAQARRGEDIARDGRTFAVFTLERTYCAEHAGQLSVPAPHLRFAYATHFEHNILSDSVPLDWQLATVSGSALDLAIESLPDKGRPERFSGAVGRFTLSAEADSGNVRMGDSVRLVVHIVGDGNLAFPGASQLIDLDHFIMRGLLDKQTREQRTITYDLSPLTIEVHELPAVVFAYFEPGNSPEYRTLRTQPIPLNVQPAAAGSGPSPPGGGFPIYCGSGGGGLALGGSVMVLLGSFAAAILGILGLVIVLWRRMRRRNSRNLERRPNSSS